MIPKPTPVHCGQRSDGGALVGRTVVWESKLEVGKAVRWTTLVVGYCTMQEPFSTSEKDTSCTTGSQLKYAPEPTATKLTISVAQI